MPDQPIIPLSRIPLPHLFLGLSQPGTFYCPRRVDPKAFSAFKIDEKMSTAQLPLFKPQNILLLSSKIFFVKGHSQSFGSLQKTQESRGTKTLISKLLWSGFLISTEKDARKLLRLTNLAAMVANNMQYLSQNKIITKSEPISPFSWNSTRFKSTLSR